jgi:hypothetical protein
VVFEFERNERRSTIHSKGSTTEESIAYLQACRPKVSPNDGFINQLKAFEESLGAANVG